MKRLTIAAACLASVAVGTIGGHYALMPHDLAYRPVKAPQVQATPKATPDRFAPSSAWVHAGPLDQLDAYSAMVKEVDANQTCLRDVAHSYRGVFADDGKAYQDLPSTTHPGMHYRMGEYVKGVCDGPGANLGWHKVGHELADVLAEGGSKGADSFDWEDRCLTTNDGEADLVVCDDGRTDAL